MTRPSSLSAQYSVTIRLECPHQAGWLAKISATIADNGGLINAIDLVQINGGNSVRDYGIECASTDHEDQIIDAVKSIEGVDVLSVSDDTFLMHLGGKIQVTPKVPIKTRNDLSMAYTPGVARICTAIHEDYDASFNLTIRANCIAVVSDGSAVLGLGNIGPTAAMPVMEGKCVLFKEFGAVDAFPICVDTQDTQEIINLCKAIAPTFGGINLEDIAAPRCFEIEQTLRKELDIPVFHDDQHGTAVVVLAGLMNALKTTGRQAADMKVVVAGAGAAGIACSKVMHRYGVGKLVVCDSKGAIHKDRDLGTNSAKQWAADNTNPDNEQGSLKEVIRGADIFIGLSGPGVLERADIENMQPRPIVFAMSNPTPEVMPEDISDLTSVLATGRSDYPNQINNVLAFPGIFRGTLDARASDINGAMKQAAASAIAAMVGDNELSPEYIIPSVFNKSVVTKVAAAVAQAAHDSKVARRVPKASSLDQR